LDFIAQEVFFGQNCAYDLQGVDQKDINKGGGLAYKPWLPANRGETVMWGWRWNLETALVELSAYYHIAGKTWKGHDGEGGHLAVIELEKEFLVWIEKLNGKYRVNFLTRDGASGTDTKQFEHRYTYARNVNAYFGGNKTAPHQMEFYTRCLSREQLKQKINEYGQQGSYAKRRIF